MAKNSSSLPPESLSYGHIYGMGAVTALAGLLFGFDTGVISGAQAFIFETFGITQNDVATSALKGFVVASVPLGALIGAILSGLCADKLGRRKSILLTALLFIAGALSTAFAGAIEHVIGGRFVMGVAIGISAMVAPMYLSEISPAKIRGLMITFFQLAITIGLVLAFTANYFFADWITDTNLNWRWMFGIGAIPAVALFAGMLGMPCSPRWLLAKGMKKEAQSVIETLHGKSAAEEEMKAIKESLMRKEGSWRDCFKPKMLPLLVMAFGLFVLQQLSGINAIMYYGPSVFERVGFGENGQLLAQIAIGVVNVGMTIVSLWVIDRLGRRPILFGGFFGMCVCLTLLGACLGSESTSPFTGWLSLIATLAFIGCFAISLGPIPYIIMSEVFPLKIRASGMAIASCANWAFNMLVTESFPVLQNTLGMGKTFSFFAVCTGIGIIFTLKYIPETKNRSLETLENNLYAGKPLRRLGEMADEVA